MIHVVTATRLDPDQFKMHSPLGQSLERLYFEDRICVHATFLNDASLSVVYNSFLAGPAAGGIVVFAHDDIWLDDYHFCTRILEGLNHFDVLGVAGNRRRVPGQPSWCFLDGDWTMDDLSNLSGCVAHGDFPFGCVSAFGEAPIECELLDGVLLAVRIESLVKTGIRFDPRFKFHFYDLDFCRQARLHGLRLGTWPISITHSSCGSFGTAEWREAYLLYLQKWGEQPESSRHCS